MNLLKYMQILSFVLPVAFLSCSNDTIEDVHYTPQTKIGQKLLAGSETVARVYTDTSFVVALGVTETDVRVGMIINAIIIMLGGIGIMIFMKS